MRKCLNNSLLDEDDRGVERTLENAHIYIHTSIYLNKLTVVRRQNIVCIYVFVFLEVINKETMQNDYLNHHTPSTTTNTDQIHSDDEHSSYSHPTTNIDAAQVEEKEHGNDEKRIEIEVDNNKNDRPLIQVVMPDDSSTFSFYEEFHYREPQQNQHTNSHDSLLQPDHHLMDNMNTTASSTDDLSTTHQLSSSVFHSKDSALGLSDDNLNGLQTNQFIIIDDDEEEDDDQQEQILSSSSFIEQPNQSKYLIVSFTFFLI